MFYNLVVFIVEAIKSGHKDIVELLLDKWPEDIDRYPGINKVSGYALFWT